MTLDRLAPGTPVIFRWTKWDGSRHWHHECVYLGSDRWGDWLGQLPGWRSARPGRTLLLRTACVVLVPSDSGEWVYTRNAAPASTTVYIDLAWNAGWTDGEPTAIDMDLDVVRRREPRGLYVDDRDEWDEHRVAYGYPDEVQRRIEEQTVWLEGQVRGGHAPFDDATAEHWLGRLAELGLTRFPRALPPVSDTPTD